MAEITAKDVKALRDATGAGMMDAKRALTESGGDFDRAGTLLRERGLAKAAARSDNANAEGTVALTVTDDGGVGAMVELKAETDFGAKSPALTTLAAELADAVAAGGEAAAAARQESVDDLRVTLKENIELGRVVRFEAPAGGSIGSYLHVQSGRGVNGVLVELSGADAELAHDLAVHIAFGRPGHLRREDVPPADVEAERSIAEAQTRMEGKPEAAMPKIVEGKLTGWYKRVPGGVLLDQPFAKDDKRSVASVLGSAQIVRFAQVVIGE